VAIVGELRLITLKLNRPETRDSQLVPKDDKKPGEEVLLLIKGKLTKKDISYL
jgi:hypothetical protein